MPRRRRKKERALETPRLTKPTDLFMPALPLDRIDIG